MNKKVSSEWIKTIFLYGVIGFMGYVTFSAVMKATGDYILAGLSLFLFDGGAYAGYQMLTGHAEGAHQRTTAKAVLWTDFLLAGFMVAGGLDLIPGLTVRVVMLISAVINGGFLYYYETHSPDTLEDAQEQDEADAQTLAAARNRRKLYKQAIKRADMNIAHQAPALGDLMALRAQAELKNAMRLPMTAKELKAWNEDVIEAEEIPALPDYAQPQPLGFWELIKGFFTRGQRMPSHVTPSQPDAPQPLPQDQPQPNQDAPQP
jgi:hypothetical protein